MPSVVVDTNVVVRAVLTPDSTIARLLWRAAEYEAFVSDDLADEVNEVLGRTHLLRRMTRYGVAAEREGLLRIVRAWHRVRPTVRVTVCRDPDDNMLLECALAAKADYLVTGDEDLLVLREFEGTRIVTPGEFTEILDQIPYN